MDIITTLYIFIGLAVVLIFALAVSLRAILRLKSAKSDSSFNLSDTLLAFENEQSRSFINTIEHFQENLFNTQHVTERNSKLGHDINGALQVMMFTSSRIKKKNSNEEVTPLVTKFDKSIAKIKDLVASNRSLSKEMQVSTVNIGLEDYLNSLAEHYIDIYKTKNISYKVINDASSANIVINKSDKYILELVLNELFCDFWLYSEPNLTLPICITKSPKKFLIEMTFNLKKDHLFFKKKYLSVQEKVENGFISLIPSKSKNNSFKVSIAIPEL